MTKSSKALPSNVCIFFIRDEVGGPKPLFESMAFIITQRKALFFLDNIGGS
jgi:hypothetical protein